VQLPATGCTGGIRRANAPFCAGFFGSLLARHVLWQAKMSAPRPHDASFLFERSHKAAVPPSWIERFYESLALGASVGEAVSRANRGATRQDRRAAVMIVDDDADVREALGECLRAEGFEVHLAVDGKHALDTLKLGAQPSVIFLDLRMPVLSGYEVLNALRSAPQWRSIPVVIVTAEHETNARDLEGAFAILRKPTNLDAVLAIAQRAITETPACSRPPGSS
jgi:CheY-like chemotaxis protein